MDTTCCRWTTVPDNSTILASVWDVNDDWYIGGV
jgi:hypothetical protein